jgi:hypothetical protein
VTCPTRSHLSASRASPDEEPQGAVEELPMSRTRVIAAAATLVALVSVIVTPATAAAAQHHAAGRPSSTGGLVVGLLCLAAIVATAGAVLWYTARTRRTSD